MKTQVPRLQNILHCFLKLLAITFPFYSSGDQQCWLDCSVITITGETAMSAESLPFANAA